MLVFAILDLLGYLIDEDLEHQKLRHPRIMTHNLSRQNTDVSCAVRKRRRAKIVKLFRHGIMHQFFPKASAVAKMGESSCPLILSQGTPCLNVDRLSEDVVNAVREDLTRREREL